MESIMSYSALADTLNVAFITVNMLTHVNKEPKPNKLTQQLLLCFIIEQKQMHINFTTKYQKKF